jgi:hypothetical protein
MRTNYYHDQNVARYVYAPSKQPQVGHPIIASEGIWQEISDLTVGQTYAYHLWVISAGNSQFIDPLALEGSYSADGNLRLAFLDESYLGSNFTPNTSPTLRQALVGNTFAWASKTGWIPYSRNNMRWADLVLTFTATASSGYILLSPDARPTPGSYYDSTTYGNTFINSYIGAAGISIEPIGEPHHPPICDKDGCLYRHDRVARFSKITGEIIFHEIVEAKIVEVFGYNLDEHAVAIVGVQDDKIIRESLVMLTIRDISISDVHQRLMATNTRTVWVPEVIKRVQKIPVLSSGKIDLDACQELLSSE